MTRWGEWAVAVKRPRKVQPTEKEATELRKLHAALVQCPHDTEHAAERWRRREALVELLAELWERGVSLRQCALAMDTSRQNVHRMIERTGMRLR